jgi:hypothetical protein
LSDSTSYVFDGAMTEPFLRRYEPQILIQKGVFLPK